jgi:hypothetical protein
MTKEKAVAEETKEIVTHEKETTAVATTQDTNAELLAQLRAGSGEGEGNQYPRPAEIRVDNDKTDTDINGRMVPVLNAPMWTEKVENRDENGELLVDEAGRPTWRWEPLTPEINAVVLKTQYMIKKKYVKDDPEPYFYSRPFNSCSGGGIIDIYFDKAVVASMDYSELKASGQFGGKFDLVMVIYLWCEDNELRIIKNKGTVRSAMFDYFKKFKSPDSITAHWTNFKATMMTNAAGLTFNGCELSINHTMPVNLTDILAKQKYLNDSLTFVSKTMEEKADDQIKEIMESEDQKRIDPIIDDIPFS